MSTRETQRPARPRSWFPGPVSTHHALKARLAVIDRAGGTWHHNRLRGPAGGPLAAAVARIPAVIRTQRSRRRPEAPPSPNRTSVLAGRELAARAIQKSQATPARFRIHESAALSARLGELDLTPGSGREQLSSTSPVRSVPPLSNRCSLTSRCCHSTDVLHHLCRQNRGATRRAEARPLLALDGSCRRPPRGATP
jgi:hypothetical protein